MNAGEHVLGTGLAAATWGISGPSFLKIYWVLVVAATLFGLWLRRRHTPTPPSPTAVAALAELTPVELGLLRSRTFAVLAAMTALRTAGILDAQAKVLRQSREDDDVDATTELVLRHLKNDQGSSRRPDPKRYRVTVAGAEGALADRGLLRTDKQRRAMRAGIWPMLAVGAFGVARLSAGASAGKPVGYLLISLVAVVIIIVAFAMVNRVTPAGQKELRAASKRLQHLDPKYEPDFGTYGPKAAAISAALFGAAALMFIDPQFASADLVRRQLASYDGTGGLASTGGDGGGGGGSGGCGGGGGCGG